MVDGVGLRPWMFTGVCPHYPIRLDKTKEITI